MLSQYISWGFNEHWTCSLLWWNGTRSTLLLINICSTNHLKSLRVGLMGQSGDCRRVSSWRFSTKRKPQQAENWVERMEQSTCRWSPARLAAAAARRKQQKVRVESKRGLWAAGPCWHHSHFHPSGHYFKTDQCQQLLIYSELVFKEK